MRTYIEDGVFRNQYKRCACCSLELHVYHYPLSNGVRSLITCVACKRDCRGSADCKLGMLV
ncbi:hypothetical protein SAMN04489716_1617 [Actinoplanes derwentensis]|uniref:Uncharacterized protein n=1 Tax=Actinoplanes derwentensis TaxID=113562 RepID=A0A1H1V2H6_9ACTN|nr:hypothetical protein Ade03nite_87560 [Actinoplanes derwentensis]SDS78810.1 hypothetical protein SAMN04489716_1617 [Actinoplanes derwentensis]